MACDAYGNELIRDLNGNLVSKSTPLSTTNYTYNVWGNMSSGAGATYGYNAQNLRTYKTVGNETDSFTLVSGNVWSDGEADYFRGIELISNGTQLYLYNIRGDVIQLTDLSGNVTKTYDYDAYGNELQRDLADENPFRYCGEYYDTETGFVYLRARYYDPMVGRFTSVDPIKSGLNWYGYCDNNPVTRLDKTGQAWETVFDLFSLGSSIAEVCANPYDPWAWGGLAGDTLDVVVPFLGGVGEAVEAFKYANKAMDVADDIIDAGDTIHDVAKAADRIEDAVDGITDVGKTLDNVAESAGDVARKTDFYVAPDGVSFPASKAEFDNNLSKMELREGKYYGVDSNGNEIRVRVEQHDPKPDFKGPPSPYHEKPHFHFDRKKNVKTGKWITTYTGGMEMLY